MTLKKIILIFLAISLSCNKINYYPDKEYKKVDTKLIAHKAGGGIYSHFQENSIEGAEHGLSVLDGVEVDIQISKDGTLWLSHNVGLPNCGGIEYSCFPNTTDSEIVALDSCMGKTRNFTKLEDVFLLLSSTYPKKYISIDVKAWYSCASSDVGLFGEMTATANEIIRLTNKYNLHNRVLVECETATFLSYLKEKGDGIETYLATFGDFDRGVLIALDFNFTGISFKYKFKDELSPSHIHLLRKKGLKIQVWVVNKEEFLIEAISINPDFIQTDTVSYFE